MDSKEFIPQGHKSRCLVDSLIGSSRQAAQLSFIHERIPHREPFLWVDAVTEVSENHLIAQKNISPELDIFQGHYPDHPIMPGVLLCEAVFQAGALLISEIVSRNKNCAEMSAQLPVLTRIQRAKFKREVHPGDTITIDVRFSERVSNAWFMKGKVLVDGKVAVKVDFACALTEQLEYGEKANSVVTTE